MSESIYVLTPVGRIVQGSLFVPSTKGFGGVVLETPQYFVRLAIPKGPEFDAMWGQIHFKAQQDFPGGEWQHDGVFKWKLQDGDRPEHSGKEGYPGHFVLKLTSQFPPEVYDAQVPPQPILDPNAVRKGYYIQCSIGVRGNGKQIGGNAGMYLNLGQVQLAGYGAEISSGPDAATTFAQRGALPPGASATPLAPAVGMGAPAPGGYGTPPPGPAPGAPQYAPPAGAQAPPAAPAPAPQYAPPGAPPPQYAPPAGAPPQYAPPGAPVPGFPPAPGGYVPPAAPQGPPAAPAPAPQYAPPGSPPPPAYPVGTPAGPPPAAGAPPMPGVPSTPGQVGQAPGFLDPNAPPPPPPGTIPF